MNTRIALQDTWEKYNMRINTKKTKIISMSTVEGRTMKITVNGQNLERVKQFCYFGSLMTEDCRSCHDIRRRNALGKEAFDKKSDLMRGSLNLHLKKRIVKAFVWSVALYGSETWTLQKKIFGDLRHLKYGYGGEWWKYHGLSTKQNTEDGWDRKK